MGVRADGPFFIIGGISERREKMSSITLRLMYMIKPTNRNLIITFPFNREYIELRKTLKLQSVYGNSIKFLF